MDKLLNEAHRVAQPHQELCPLCNAPLIVRNAELKCISDVCRERCIEACDGC